MEIKALRNIISTNHGNITKGETKNIPNELAEKWIKAGAAEKTKPVAKEKEKAVKPPVSEKAVK